MPDTAHQPYLLLCTSVLDAGTAKAGNVPVTLVAPASTAASHLPDAEMSAQLGRGDRPPLNSSLSTPWTLDSASQEVTVQRLEHAAYFQTTTALKVSAHPP